MFIVRRYQFIKLLESSQSALTTSRFLRLIALAVTQIAFSLPVVIYIFVIVCQTRPNAYVSWENVHYDFGQITMYTDRLWSEALATTGGPSTARVYELTYWTPGIGAYLFFLFFGMGEESITGYRACWGWLMAKTGWQGRSLTRSSRFDHR